MRLFMTTTITNCEFNRNVCRAKRAAGSGPVVITNRGSAAFVLLAYDEYLRIVNSGKAKRRAPTKNKKRAPNKLA